MDGGGQHQNGRLNYYKAAMQSPLNNTMPQHPAKEQNNALVMGQKVLSILHDKDKAIEERNAAVAQKLEAYTARDEALQEREKALAERDKALMERDNALAALMYRQGAINFGGNQRGSKRIPHPSYNADDMAQAHNTSELHTTVETEKPRQTKRAKNSNTESMKEIKASRKVNRAADDHMENETCDFQKVKKEWDNPDMGLNLISFNESMPTPVCSCTGTPRQCYKWANGGWQSSCCTTTMSCHPLPLIPNKRGSRVGGRKMSGSVFSKLLSRLASEGYDFLIPVDLKDYWAKHGTNRYITIK